jgi:hypothetical protein
MIQFAVDPVLIALLYAGGSLGVALLGLWVWRVKVVPAPLRALILATCALLSTGAIIQSGASADLWTIDPTSKAGRVSLYDVGGNALAPAELARAEANILVRQTATTAAGACVWGLRNNNSTRTIQVLRIKYSMSFDGTGAASLMRYEWVKATAVTVFSGGVAVTPALLKTSLGAPTQAEVRVLDTGLTTTGITGAAALYGSNWPRLTFSATQAGGISGQHLMDFAELGAGPLELAQNEILCLRNGPTNASVVGDTVLGGVLFIEK